LNKRYPLLVTGLLLALALAACGGSGSSSGSSSTSSDGGSGDEALVAEAIEKSLTEPSPAACKELETKNFMEQTTHATGSDAIKACEEEGAEADGESVDVSNVQITGSKASADTAFSGGSFSEQTLTIALVKSGDQWQLDEITGFAKLDKEALIKAIEEDLTELPSSVVGCITEGLKSSSDDVFEGLLLRGEQDQLTELAKSCTAG
jgi:hypothetical protein